MFDPYWLLLNTTDVWNQRHISSWSFLTPLKWSRLSSRRDDSAEDKLRNQTLIVGVIISAMWITDQKENNSTTRVAHLRACKMKRWCTDTTLPTEGSAALRPLSSFSARGSCWRVIAVSECASYSCGSFWDTVSSCTLGWNQEAVDSHREATVKYGAIRAARVKWSLRLSSPCYYGLWTDWLDRTGGRLEETRAFQTSSRL